MFKKTLKVIAYIILVILLMALVIYTVFYIKWSRASATNMAKLGPPAQELSVDGYAFRDLNKNGSLDVYEDTRRSIEERVEDLLRQMTLEEKTGLQFITMIGMHPDGKLGEIPTFKDPFTFAFESNSSMVVNKHMNHFNIIQSPKRAENLVDWHNALQEMAERTRLGIPVTIATDPRHGTLENVGAGIVTPFFSQWPSALGLGATGDSVLVRSFGDVARREYASVGIRLSLHPQIDLPTEPRWARISGSFSEDADLTSRLVQAYILGFQGDSLGHQSVACMTKHFPGGGPQMDGEDAHFAYGREQVYPGGRFSDHLKPFRAALKAGTAQIMPYYGMPMGTVYEEVGFGFNKGIIQGLLRDSLGFDGVVCTDWGLVTDLFVKKASAWGVEDLTVPERIKKILDAGCDMFGGEAIPSVVVELVNQGLISTERIDLSVRRILRDKFRLGLFDQPYIDKAGLTELGNESDVEKGREAQRRALVLLKNENAILPLKPDTKIYVEGIDPEAAKAFGKVVNSPAEADVNILKLATPYEPRSASLIERFFHQGRLDFPQKEKDKYLKLIRSKPTIVIMTLERPTVFPEINAEAAAVVADFYCSNDIIMELVYGRFNPSGKLPIEIPSSMDAVEQQLEDVPYDSQDPLYEFGAGMGWKE